MAPTWSSQPLKAIYTIFALVTTPPLLLLLFIKYLVKPFRPVPEWSIKTSLVCAMMRVLFQYVAATQSQFALYAAPEKAKKQHTRIVPQGHYALTGIMASYRKIVPVEVDAVWFPSPEPQDATDFREQMRRVILHFPGGAFVMAFGHTEMGQDVSDSMAKHMKATRTVWAQCRLSGPPKTHFPAALQDAITFYRHLLSLGVHPQNVILSGDSSGGNLALALLRHLEAGQAGAGQTDAGQSLPLPGGVLAFSPWVHITRHAARDYNYSPNSRVDMLAPSLLHWGGEAYLPEDEFSSEVEAYVSPLHHPFKLKTPLFVQAGTSEGFYQDIKLFAAQMTDMNGTLIKFHETAQAPHNLLLAGKGLGLEDELAVALDAAYSFMSSAHCEAANYCPAQGF